MIVVWRRVLTPKRNDERGARRGTKEGFDARGTPACARADDVADVCGRPALAGHLVDDHQHPGFGPARRARPAVRAPDGLRRQDDRGWNRSGARAGGEGRSGRRARACARARKEIRRGRQDARPAARHVQRLRHHRSAGRSREDQGDEEGGRRVESNRGEPRPLRLTRRQLGHPRARKVALEAGSCRSAGGLVHRGRAGHGRDARHRR